MIEENLNITEADLKSVRFDDVHSEAKAEAL